MWNWLHVVATPFVRFWEWFGKWLFAPPPPKPRIIPYDPNHFPTGPNLVKNGSFELGNFAPGVTNMIVQGLGVITDWLVHPPGNARWIDTDHFVFRYAADGRRLVDLTGGAPPGPGRVLAYLIQSSPALEKGKSYEFSIELGVGPNNGSSENFGPPVKVAVSLNPGADALDQLFVCVPENPPTDYGVLWERYYFHFWIPATYAVGPLQISIRGSFGHYFIGVDNVAVRVLT